MSNTREGWLYWHRRGQSASRENQWRAVVQQPTTNHITTITTYYPLLTTTTSSYCYLYCSLSLAVLTDLPTRLLPATYASTHHQDQSR